MIQGADIGNQSLKGLIPRIVEQIFAAIVMADSSIEYTVKVSYMEIYMEKIKDLLARKLPIDLPAEQELIPQLIRTTCPSTKTRLEGSMSRD
jgi:hypothetical protein